MKYFYYSSIFLLYISILYLFPGCIGNNPYHPALPKPTHESPLISIFQANQSLTEEETERKNQARAQLKTLPFNTKDMNEKQLRIAIACYVELEDLNTAIIYLERLLIHVSDENALKPLRLQLADLYFEIGNFAKAGKHYALFKSFYPGSEEREYVQYKEILCRFYEVLAANKDQTKTKHALLLAEAYLAEKEIFIEYRNDVTIIKHECKKLLAQHEVDVFNTNMMVNNIKGAEKRLNYLKSNYEAYVTPEDILRLEITLDEHKGESIESLAKKHTQLDQLITAHQSKNESIILAHQSKKKSAIERF